MGQIFRWPVRWTYGKTAVRRGLPKCASDWFRTPPTHNTQRSNHRFGGIIVPLSIFLDTSGPTAVSMRPFTIFRICFRICFFVFSVRRRNTLLSPSHVHTPSQHIRPRLPDNQRDLNHNKWNTQRRQVSTGDLLLLLRLLVAVGGIVSAAMRIFHVWRGVWRELCLFW